MVGLIEQLQRWAVKAEKTLLTSEVKAKLGVLGSVAEAHDKKIDAFKFTYDVNGAKVVGFLVAPKSRPKRLPVIIYNRGGTANFGLVTNGLLFTKLAGMAEQGYIIVGSQYPGNVVSGGHDERGGESDIASVLRLHELIKNLDSADEKNIGMYGVSRGGMMTYLCMKKVSWIKTALTMGGSTNLDRSIKDRPEMSALYEKHFGNTIAARNARSAVKWAHKLNKKTPLCLIHGGADDKVNVRDALELAEKLEEAHHPYSLHILKDGSHNLMNLQKERDAIVKNWFNQYLKPSR